MSDQQPAKYQTLKAPVFRGFFFVLLCHAVHAQPAGPASTAVELATTCIPAGDDGLQVASPDCTVREFNKLVDIDGKATWYALYSNFPNLAEQAPGRAKTDFANVLVLFESVKGSDQLLPFRVSNPEGSFYNQFQTPRVISTSIGMILYAPGFGAGDGRGQFEYDQYFLWQQDGWVELEAFAWVRQVNILLPRAHRLDGVYKDSFDLMAMRYYGPVRRDDDCHTCATGGNVGVMLEMRDNKFLLKSFSHTPPKADESTQNDLAPDAGANHNHLRGSTR